MKRTIEQWKNCSPKAMATDMSDAAKCFAFEDAKADILELHAIAGRFKDLLRQIAYPRRGTEEENMDIFAAAKLIQSNFTIDELSDEA